MVFFAALLSRCLHLLISCSFKLSVAHTLSYIGNASFQCVIMSTVCAVNNQEESCN